MKHSNWYIGVLVAAIVCLTSNAFAGGPPPAVPDGGSTGLLLVAALAGLTFVRKLVR
jgi:hypothetical protein